MSIEIEVKAYADDLNRVEKKLVELGAKYEKTVEETDRFFNSPIRDFAKTDEALRIRASKTLAGGRYGAPKSKAVMTYKGPKLDAKSKAREEIQFELTDSEGMEKILQRMGFFYAHTVKKTRKIYYHLDFEITLDTIDGLGDFVEVETSGDEIEKARDTVLEMMKTLGLDKFERRSYLELTLAKK